MYSLFKLLWSVWISPAFGQFLFADTNLRILRYSQETNYAETPGTPAMQIARTTGDTLAYNKTQVISREIRADRMVPSVIETGVTAEGALNIELSLKTYDDLFQAVLGGTWATNVLTNGVVKRSFLFEKQFSDIGQYVQYLGMRAVEMSLNFKAQAILDGTITFWGNKVTTSTATVAASSIAATTTDDLSASADVGTLTWTGSPPLATTIKDVAITISNSPRHRPVVGSLYDADIGEGQFTVRLTGTALVDNLNLFQDVIAHSTVSLTLPVSDAAGNTLSILLPALKLSGNPDTPAGNQDVDFRFTGEAFRDTVTNSMIQLTRVEP
jgi:hypothetical protein